MQQFAKHVNLIELLTWASFRIFNICYQTCKQWCTDYKLDFLSFPLILLRINAWQYFISFDIDLWLYVIKTFLSQLYVSTVISRKTCSKKTRFVIKEKVF